VRRAARLVAIALPLYFAREMLRMPAFTRPPESLLVATAWCAVATLGENCCDSPQCPLSEVADGAPPFGDALKPSRFTASTICSTVTRAGSNTTTASFAAKLTSARLTPLSPSRTRLTAMGQVPHVIPSTASTTVEVAAASATFGSRASNSNESQTRRHGLMVSLPCHARGGYRSSSHGPRGRRSAQGSGRARWTC
jgi:hypothetical protein